MMLIVDNIHTYYGDAHVLHGVSLKVKRGQIVTLLGRNGAGKSTTLKSIMGIVPVRFGSVRFLDRNIAEQPCEEVARLGVAYVPEERGIIPNLTVGENLRLGILGSGILICRLLSKLEQYPATRRVQLIESSASCLNSAF